MKQFILTACFAAAALASSAQIYKGKSDATSISFFSKSPMEDIDATNKKATIVMNTATNNIQASAVMLYFKFPKPLMEEHFNENYVESEKYPVTEFKGKINETIDWTKDGEHKVTVTGTLSLHGVTKNVTVDGTVAKKGNVITIDCKKMPVKLADYNIKVPSLYVQTIAEVIDVTIHSEMEPFVKK